MIPKEIENLLTKNLVELRAKKKAGSYWSIFNGNKEILHNKKNQASVDFYAFIGAALSATTLSGTGDFSYSGQSANSPTAYYNVQIEDTTSGNNYPYMQIVTQNNGNKMSTTTSYPNAVFESGNVSLYYNFGIINGGSTSDTLTACYTGFATNNFQYAVALFALTGLNIPYNPSIALSVTQTITVP